MFMFYGIPDVDFANYELLVDMYVLQIYLSIVEVSRPGSNWHICEYQKFFNKKDVYLEIALIPIWFKFRLHKYIQARLSFILHGNNRPTPRWLLFQIFQYFQLILITATLLKPSFDWKILKKNGQAAVF